MKKHGMKAASPRLKLAAPHVMQATGPDRHKVRMVAEPWRRWYKTTRWERLRNAVLLRDGWTCQRTGLLLVHGKHAANSAVVHHIEAHHGNEVLFWSEENCQAVSKAWHDVHGQREDREG